MTKHGHAISTMKTALLPLLIVLTAAIPPSLADPLPSVPLPPPSHGP